MLQFPLSVFPSVITAVIEASVSFNRLYHFLMSEELDPEAVSFEPITPFNDAAPTERVSVKDAAFKWNPTDTETLKSINFSVQDKKLLAIVGSVGSGKSSVISALLGEMYKVRGTVSIRGSVAYVPQTAWIMNATLRTYYSQAKQKARTFCLEGIMMRRFITKLCLRVGFCLISSNYPEAIKQKSENEGSSMI